VNVTVGKLRRRGRDGDATLPISTLAHEIALSLPVEIRMA
jgi:hypothetical protein